MFVFVLLLVSYCVLCFVLKFFPPPPPAYIPISNITSKLLRASCLSVPLYIPPFHSAQSKMLNTCVGHHRVIVYLLSFFLSGRKWLMYVRSIYQIWQRDTVHLNWLSILGMALSTCGSMKMNLTLSLQTRQILLVCIIIIIIIVIVVFVIPQFGSRKRACIWPNQFCSKLLQVLHFLLVFLLSKDIIIVTSPSWGMPLLKFFWLLAILYTKQL